MIKKGTGLQLKRRYTTPGINPLDQVEYTKRRSVITNTDGSVVFEMNEAEVPASWSQLATDIIVSKYFRKRGVPGIGHETSARQVVHRLAHTIRWAGETLGGYFATADDADVFESEMAYHLIHQFGAFNSPVWFNVGLGHEYGITGSGGNWYWNALSNRIEETADAYSQPQGSACFIQAVGDDLMSIFDLARNEARLFKYGSGTGTNFSKLRGHQERLSGGGTSSGLMSFLEVLDKGAGATKSGGTTRRAAKMVCLDMDHPEIMDFINWKMREEKKVRALIDAGYPSDFNGEAYRTVSGQNSNNSVRIPDSFMDSYLKDGSWHTTFRTTGEICETFKSRQLMHHIAEAAWACADPGVQFDSIINKWHTCKNTDRINGSNPCSEYMFLDNTACNLASLNLMKYYNEQSGEFDIEAYRYAIRLFFIAQEILVDFASYPTELIAKNSHDYRPLGLGYANLGTLLMIQGIPYDSDKGRAIGAALTAVLTGHAYYTSAEMAAAKGPFEGYPANREPMLEVMGMHRQAAYAIDSATCPADLVTAARENWDLAVDLGKKHGYRNAQATVIAPTGTIGLLMDCDTTGIEPDFALVKFKKLAGGGYFKIINQSIPMALKRLGYTEKQVEEIVHYVKGTSTLIGAPEVNIESLLARGVTKDAIDKIEAALPGVFDLRHAFHRGTLGEAWNSLAELGYTEEQIDAANQHICGTMTIEGAPHLKPAHLPIFDCANKCGATGQRYLAAMSHVKMMAATQPFVSGAISKTINLPHECSVDEIEQLYVESWRLGLKDVALYRDGSKNSQPLSTSSKEEKKTKTEVRETATETELPMVAATSATADIHPEVAEGKSPPPQRRHRMPKKRLGFTQEARVAGQKIYLRTGEYEDGSLGEIFIDLHKEGAAFRSLTNCFAIAVSLGLQHGVPLQEYVDAFTFTRFDPSGACDHPNIKMCTSVIDYVFRVLGMEYVGRTDFLQIKPEDMVKTKTPAVQVQGNARAVARSLDKLSGSLQANGHTAPKNGNGNGHGRVHLHGIEHKLTPDTTDAAAETLPNVMIIPTTQTAAASGGLQTLMATGTTAVMSEHLAGMMGDAPFCDQCGNVTVRNGSCYRCLNCGNSMGCS